MHENLSAGTSFPAPTTTQQQRWLSAVAAAAFGTWSITDPTTGVSRALVLRLPSSGEEVVRETEFAQRVSFGSNLF